MLRFPQVSVIIPNYNHAIYLSKRIESVLHQSFSNTEIILLDDCSSDNSREVIDHYVSLDKRIISVFNDKNSGSVFRQWHKGLTLARGKYVWIAESDDYAEPNFLSSLVPLLEYDDSLTFAYSNSRIVNERSVAIGEISDIKKKIFNTDYWSHDYVADGIQELRQYLSLQCTVNNASAALFRRSSIDAAGGIDISFRYTGDWMMYIKLSLRGGIAYKAECLNNYREHQVNASKKSLSDGSQLFERQKCFAFVYSSNALDKKSREIMLTQASDEYLRLMFLLIREKQEPFILLRMITDLVKISFNYYTIIQYRSIKMMNTFRLTFKKI